MVLCELSELRPLLTLICDCQAWVGRGGFVVGLLNPSFLEFRTFFRVQDGGQTHPLISSFQLYCSWNFNALHTLPTSLVLCLPNGDLGSMRAIRPLAWTLVSETGMEPGGNP